MFNKSRLLSYHFLDLFIPISPIFCSHFLDFSQDLQTVHGTRKVIQKVYEERMLVESLWTMKQNRRNLLENCKCIIDKMHLILLWRLTLNQRLIQSPDEHLWCSFFEKIFKGWLIITLFWEKMPAQVLLSQHLLVQSQEWKDQKNLWKLFKVDNKGTRATSIMPFRCLYF